MHFLVEVPKNVLKEAKRKASLRKREAWEQNEWVEQTLACAILDGLYNFEEHLKDGMYDGEDVIKDDFRLKIIKES